MLLIFRGVVYKYVVMLSLLMTQLRGSVSFDSSYDASACQILLSSIEMLLFGF